MDPFIGEVRMMSFAYPPRGWAQCNGQLLPINQNQALFSLLGTNYGGDGITNFAVPDLRGRVPIHLGNGHTLGEMGGAEAQTLTLTELPAHTHLLNATSDDANTDNPTDSLLGKTADKSFAPNGSTIMGSSTVGAVGGSQPHTNTQPSLVIGFCIALMGIFPSQS